MSSGVGPTGENDQTAAIGPITPEELRRAVDREGVPYIANFVGLFEALNAAIAERDAARISGDTPEQTVSAEEMADMRRRAGAIEAEYERLRAEDDRRRQIADAAAQVGEGAPRGLWGRLARRWRG